MKQDLLDAVQEALDDARCEAIDELKSWLEQEAERAGEGGLLHAVLSSVVWCIHNRETATGGYPSVMQFGMNDHDRELIERAESILFPDDDRSETA